MSQGSCIMSVFLCFFLFLQRLIIVWTDHKDDLLLREILLFEPFKFKPHTKERGNAWKMVGDNLNQLDSEQFKVDQRGVREKFGILKRHLEAKTREELKASGIAPE